MQDQAPTPPGDAGSPAAWTPPSAPQHAAAQPTESRDETARLRRLITLFLVLAAVMVAPNMAYRIKYALTSAEERARYDVARQNLTDVSLVQISNASRSLTNKVTPSVVSIHAHRRGAEGQGSGVIVDEQGYIITNQHVVRGVRMVEVQLSDGRRGSAAVVGVDPQIDVAVLKTEMADLTPAEWGDSDALQVGDLVWAFGSPFGLEKSTTFGILSQKGRHGITEREGAVQEFLQTDAAVNPGNSGGPLVNIEGQVVGINTAIVGSGYQGISFAIPSVLVRDSFQQLRDKGRVDRGFLGVKLEEVPDYVARRLGLKLNDGVFVRHVNPDTPAAMGGIEPGDVILEWGGQSYSDSKKLSQDIAASAAGVTVPLKVRRFEAREPRTVKLEVTLVARPVSP